MNVEPDLTPVAMPYINEWFRMFNRMEGLPSIPLLFVGCFFLSFSLRGMPFVKNEHIKLYIHILGVVGCVLLGLSSVPNGPASAIAYLVRQSIYGTVAAGTAWITHVKLMKRFDNGTEFIKKQTDPK